jgi:uncharacterized protein YciI
MKKLFVLLLIAFTMGCKEEAKAPEPDIIEQPEMATKSIENLIEDPTEILKQAPVKTIKQLKEELISKGYKTFNYVDKKTKDTVLMQQYFLVFLKKGPIRGQNEEEAAELQKLHMEYLAKMYELGYADISGPCGEDGDLRGITIYNVPNLKMADSLANADPMVISGRLQTEIHPWWAAKGFMLR